MRSATAASGSRGGGNDDAGADCRLPGDQGTNVDALSGWVDRGSSTGAALAVVDELVGDGGGGGGGGLNRSVDGAGSCTAVCGAGGIGSMRAGNGAGGGDADGG